MALRTVVYFHNRPLRHDEAGLAINIIDRTWGGLLQPLDYSYGAPVGFLLAEKLAVTCLGRSEFALRLAPLAAGFVCLMLGLALARRVLAPTPGLFALAMFAIGKPFLFFSTDAKQYSLDAAAAALIVWISLRLYQDGMRSRDLALWTLSGAVAMWFSHPAVFVFAGSATTLILLSFRTQRRRLAVLAGAVCVGVNFLLHYVFFARALQADAFLVTFWSTEFQGFPPHSLGAFPWAAHAFLNTCKIPFGVPMGWLVVPLLVAGVWAFWRGERIVLAFLGLPVLFALAAASVRMFPFADRMLVFLMPALVLVIAAGLAWTAAKVGRRWRLLVPLLLGALLAECVAHAAREVVAPRRSGDVTAMLSRLESVRKPDETIAVCLGGWPAFRIYAHAYHLDQGRPAVPIPFLGDPAIIEARVKAFPVGARVWLVNLYRTRAGAAATRERLVFDAFSSRGRELARCESESSLAVLYEMKP